MNKFTIERIISNGIAWVTVIPELFRIEDIDSLTRGDIFGEHNTYFFEVL